MHYIRRPSKLVVVFMVLGAVYLAQVFTISANDPGLKQYHLSVNKAILLSLAVVIPYLAIWAVALIGYLRFRRYVRRIRSSRDGRAMYTLMCGLFWLLIWLPISSIAGNLVNHLSNTHAGWIPDMQRANTMLGIVILLAAFLLLYIGAMQILALKDWQLTDKALLWRQVFYTLYACVSAVYIYRFFAVGTPGGHPISQYFSDTALLLAVMVPRLVMWFLAIHAVWDMRSFARGTRAPIYRDGFRYIASGVGLVTLCLVAIGVLSTKVAVSRYSLGSILAIIYALLIVMAAGWLILARGAGRLDRIEQV